MTNITISQVRVGWVSGTAQRSTSSILWSCFSILLVCTWSCLRTNVPRFKEAEAGWSFWHGLPFLEWLLVRKWTKKFGLMLFIILAPEIVVSRAVTDLLGANWDLYYACVESQARASDSYHPTDDEMAYCYPELNPKLDLVEAAALRSILDKLTVTHAVFANMGGISIRTERWLRAAPRKIPIKASTARHSDAGARSLIRLTEPHGILSDNHGVASNEADGQHEMADLTETSTMIAEGGTETARRCVYENRVVDFRQFGEDRLELDRKILNINQSQSACWRELLVSRSPRRQKFKIESKAMHLRSSLLASTLLG